MIVTGTLYISCSVVDPHPGFYLNVDLDPGCQTNADPDPGQTLSSLKVEFLHVNVLYVSERS